jgi:tRNA pseudouridine32 synthase/23S rRNA pseudouridine746 synthase
MSLDPCFHQFKTPVNGIELPTHLGYPFYYDPHRIALQAAKEIQELIEEQSLVWEHNFGLENPHNAIGKMFGVLVVQNNQGEIGYLAGFSGKLANQNHHHGFVPPVFDMLEATSFFKREEIEINQLTIQIEHKLNAPKRNRYKTILSELIEEHEHLLKSKKEKIKHAKQARSLRREAAIKNLTSDEYSNLLLELAKESKTEQLELKWLNKQHIQLIHEHQQSLELLDQEIELLKENRKNKSAQLQQKLFDNYTFLNKDHSPRSLLSIFSDEEVKTPPAGAGECSAPKLFQYAFQHHYTPVALAEFWWGKSPASEIRVHRQFYPACRGKCEPILRHMLDGLPVEANPMLQSMHSTAIDVPIFEDEHIIAINKPHELLSVPGRYIRDSVQERLNTMYPLQDGPYMVHRLDMSTSGILLVAKTREAHKYLQRQFIKHTIRKTYIAILDGQVIPKTGCIHFPMRVDLDDRPRQLACFVHGKEATTKWKVLDVSANHTRIQFEPITGRTHQLRVHSAHHLGLNCPIKGDDLYGKKADRLYLHAHQITFKHPFTKELMTLTSPTPF